ncbi:sperm-associated antigen 4 protein-like [Anser cygnoides]|uniref:sperm-associated antigen 4 protein-like n=1 Tax=Anser cygnoides TaxID=8845 RepID=UPI0006707813
METRSQGRLRALQQRTPEEHSGEEAGPSQLPRNGQSNTLQKKRLFTILLTVVAAFIVGFSGACVARMGQERQEQKVLPEQCLPEVVATRNRLAGLQDQNAKMLQEYREVVALLTDKISTLKKELQDTRDTVSINCFKKSQQMLDWALKSTGATIDLERSSETYTWDGMRLCRLFWLPCTPNTPDTILQPDVSLGNCWAFQGSRGQVVIRLPAKIRAAMVTIIHTSEMDSELGKFSSAPRDFTISGVDEEKETETLLGTFTYAVQKEPMQTFPLQEIPRAFQFIKIVIHSNWGNPEYTCIYWVQVHGRGTATSHWPEDMSSANKNKK